MLNLSSTWARAARTLAVLLAATTLCPAAMAQKAAPAKPKGKPKTTAPTTAPAAAAGAATDKETSAETPVATKSAYGPSDAARAKKGFGAAFAFTPLSDFALKYGAQLHYVMSPRFQLGFDYLTGTEDFKSKVADAPPVYVTKLSASGMAAYGWARYFTGNSFNIGAGLGIRTASLEYGLEDRSLNITIEGKADVSSIIVPAFIGNQWMWDGGFTLGVDWIEAMIPISGSSSNTTTSNISDPAIKKLSDDIADSGLKLAKTTTFTLFLTSIGWTF